MANIMIKNTGLKFSLYCYLDGCDIVEDMLVERGYSKCKGDTILTISDNFYEMSLDEFFYWARLTELKEDGYYYNSIDVTDIELNCTEIFELISNDLDLYEIFYSFDSAKDRYYEIVNHHDFRGRISITYSLLDTEGSCSGKYSFELMHREVLEF